MFFSGPRLKARRKRFDIQAKNIESIFLNHHAQAWENVTRVLKLKLQVSDHNYFQFVYQ